MPQGNGTSAPVNVFTGGANFRQVGYMRKTILVSVAALALMAAPALAQGEHHDHGGGGGGDAPHASGGGNGGGAPHTSGGGNGGGATHTSGGGGAPGGAPHAMTQRHPDRNPDHGNMGGGAGQSHQTSAPAMSAPSQGNSAMMMQGGGEHHGDRGNGNRGGGNNNFNNNNNNNNAMRGPGHNFGGNDRQRAANFDSFHRNFTAPHRYRAPHYRRPEGWYAHRWTYGERLPPAFFIRDYWLSDYFDFGLVAPPYGATWVRYGSDALLIDEETGEVIQVAYGVFY
jgi:Ni/Co efflux regulator RcnB